MSEPGSPPPGWVPPPGGGPVAPELRPFEDAASRRSRRWGVAAGVSGVMVILGPPLGIVAAIVYEIYLPPPPPEGDGPQEAWYLMIFMFGVIVWCVAWLVAVVVCSLVAANWQREARRHPELPPSIW